MNKYHEYNVIIVSWNRFPWKQPPYNPQAARFGLQSNTDMFFHVLTYFEMNQLRSEKNWQHFTDHIFKWVLKSQNIGI